MHKLVNCLLLPVLSFKTKSKCTDITYIIACDKLLSGPASSSLGRSKSHPKLGLKSSSVSQFQKDTERALLCSHANMQYEKKSEQLSKSMLWLLCLLRGQTLHYTASIPRGSHSFRPHTPAGLMKSFSTQLPIRVTQLQASSLPHDIYLKSDVSIYCSGWLSVNTQLNYLLICERAPPGIQRGNSIIRVMQRSLDILGEEQTLRALLYATGVIITLTIDLAIFLWTR